MVTGMRKETGSFDFGRNLGTLKITEAMDSMPLDFQPLRPFRFSVTYNPRTTPRDQNSRAVDKQPTCLLLVPRPGWTGTLQWPVSKTLQN